jgi:hypothetical protein
VGETVEETVRVLRLVSLPVTMGIVVYEMETVSPAPLMVRVDLTGSSIGGSGCSFALREMEGRGNDPIGLTILDATRSLLSLEDVVGLILSIALLGRIESTGKVSVTEETTGLLVTRVRSLLSPP